MDVESIDVRTVFVVVAFGIVVAAGTIVVGKSGGSVKGRRKKTEIMIQEEDLYVKR